jgi:polyphenol oxidase
MIKSTKGKISIYQSEILQNFNNLVHFFSTRRGGISSGTFESLNFGTHHGEAENMIQNLALLKQSLQLSEAHFVIPQQTHSDVVAVVDQSNCNEPFENTDAVITNLPNTIICIKTADCVPILLYDQVRKVVGAVHSGWKGTAQNILGKTIVTMNRIYGSNPSDILAVIGPCISQKNYEVGSEVVDAIKPLLKNHETSFLQSNKSSEKHFLNLNDVNYQLLIQSRIEKKNIDSPEICTYAHSNEFFSARRDGYKTGRMINGIGLL